MSCASDNARELTEDTGETVAGRVLLVGTFVSQNGYNHSVGEELKTRLGAHGWSILTTSHSLSPWGRFCGMLATVWRERKMYDVAHIDVYSGNAFLWAEAVACLLGRLHKPYILTLRGGGLPNFAQQWPGRVRRLLNSANLVSAPSRYLAVEMNQYRRRKDIVVIPNPLDVQRYRCREFHRDEIRPRLVWLRAFHAIYNPRLALNVVSQLRGEFPDIHLMMIGPDKDGSLATARGLVLDQGLERHVSFVGGVPNARVPRWLEKGDIFLNTSNIDNAPVSVLEAMASGLPVVSTNVGGIAYLLNDEVDALLVPPRDPPAMAAAVRRLLTTPKLASKLSQNGRKKAESISWEKVLPEWEDMFSSLRAGYA